MNFKISSLLLILSLFGCSSTIDYRGKQPELDDLNKIKVNQHNQEDVLTIIGSPTTTNLYGETKWFYVFKKTSSKSFLEPQTVEEQIITISFDKQGRVKDITTHHDTEVNIDTIKQTTPTQGSNAGFLQQIFGNFGRHAKQAEPK